MATKAMFVAPKVVRDAMGPLTSLEAIEALCDPQKTGTAIEELLLHGISWDSSTAPDPYAESFGLAGALYGQHLPNIPAGKVLARKCANIVLDVLDSNKAKRVMRDDGTWLAPWVAVKALIDEETLRDYGMGQYGSDAAKDAAALLQEVAEFVTGGSLKIKERNEDIEDEAVRWDRRRQDPTRKCERPRPVMKDEDRLLNMRQHMTAYWARYYTIDLLVLGHHASAFHAKERALISYVAAEIVGIRDLEQLESFVETAERDLVEYGVPPEAAREFSDILHGVYHNRQGPHEARKDILGRENNKDTWPLVNNNLVAADVGEADRDSFLRFERFRLDDPEPYCDTADGERLDDIVTRVEDFKLKNEAAKPQGDAAAAAGEHIDGHSLTAVRKAVAVFLGGMELNDVNELKKVYDDIKATAGDMLQQWIAKFS
ncbi:unnamed protein product [Pedinophyceae sp. YPF-701]|nr:unnamed protein product [Pedinophyceae sp. YPF-701]